MMKINIILPLFARVPSGGTKIMYEYASRLSEKGFNVQIYNCLKTPYYPYSKYKPFFIRKLISFFYDKNKPKPNWFSFDKEVKFNFINNISDDQVRDADIILFTWWALADPVNKLSESKGNKINIIQDYETWTGHENLVHDSYKKDNITNIAISKFVYNIVKSFDSKVSFIPNAIDLLKFSCRKPILKRSNNSFIMMYSKEYRKGSEVGLKAFQKLKKIFPDLELTLFGVSDRGEEIPDWITYLQNPNNLPELYNSHMFFVTNSLVEGWGLPLHEAMASGCVCICTDIVGHSQFIENNPGMLTYEPGDYKSLLNVLKRLLSLENHELDLISENNIKLVQKYDWNKTINQLINHF